ncbi:YiiX/YebB-like N1pC/P60 family cysteine hydrolase [Propionivibrio sp.]|uniref:YiiX/YebB-like N1pC/P60 family cysteine hydrolase n=1 Tax=Propionivibrio sp. TaxID=2212460 RepID=UPI002600ED01|nr:YiiX/YebB-like N1pC/P60 family cysteine hydrolase [Propionivibrio sp.]
MPSICLYLLVASIGLLAGWPIIGFWSTSPNPTDPSKLLAQPMVQLNDGDIIFRRGKSAVSEAVLSIDPNPIFSHVGIVVFDGTNPMVVHAVPAETEGERNAVKVEPVNRFIALDRASAIAVYRLRESNDHPSISHAAALEALRLARANTPFDTAYDLDTPDKLYCTELVWRAFRKAGMDLAPDPPRKRFLLWSGRYIPPSLLQASPLVERVCC